MCCRQSTRHGSRHSRRRLPSCGAAATAGPVGAVTVRTSRAGTRRGRCLPTRRHRRHRVRSSHVQSSRPPPPPPPPATATHGGASGASRGTVRKPPPPPPPVAIPSTETLSSLALPLAAPAVRSPAPACPADRGASAPAGRAAITAAAQPDGDGARVVGEGKGSGHLTAAPRRSRPIPSWYHRRHRHRR